MKVTRNKIIKIIKESIGEYHDDRFDEAADMLVRAFLGRKMLWRQVNRDYKYLVQTYVGPGEPLNAAIFDKPGLYHYLMAMTRSKNIYTKFNQMGFSSEFYPEIVKKALDHSSITNRQYGNVGDDNLFYDLDRIAFVYGGFSMNGEPVYLFENPFPEQFTKNTYSMSGPMSGITL